MLLGTGSRRSIDEAMWKYSPDYEYEDRKKCQPKPPMPRKNKNKKKKKVRNNNPRGKLEALFEQEREFSSRTPIVVLHPDSASPRRHKIALSDTYSERHTTNTCGRQDSKFEADVLRAECNLLRMENDLLIKRCHSLLINSKESKQKVWKAATLEGQVEELHKKLQRLRRNSELREVQLHLHLLLGKCSTNFGRQPSSLNHLNSYFDFRTTSPSSSRDSTNSPTFLYQDEDFPTSGSASKRSYTVHCQTIQASQEESLRRKFRSLFSEDIVETDRCSNRNWNRLTRMAGYANVRGGVCSDRCQGTVRRIAQEVQGETEQWRQIQEILNRVHREMENLQKSRDFWKEQATKSQNTAAKLKHTVYKWKERARVSEMKHHQGQLQLQSEITESRYKVKRHTEEEEEGESRDVSSYCASESPESCRRERESDVQTKHMTMQLSEEKRSRGTQTRGARKLKGLVDITNHDKSSNIIMSIRKSPAPRMYTQENRPPVYHPR